MNGDVLICNFTGVYEDEGLTGAYDFIDFSDMSGTRMYVDEESEKEILKRLDMIGFPGSYRLRFLDNGNYHYMTRIMSSYIKEPFDLITFDNHTDDQAPAFEGAKSCGSWRLDIRSENLFLQQSMLVQSSDGFRNEYIPSRLPLYISLDKDILSADVLKTNWDQGDMKEAELFDILGELFKTREVIAFDICGEDLPEESCEANREFNRRLISAFAAM